MDMKLAANSSHLLKARLSFDNVFEVPRNGLGGNCFTWKHGNTLERLDWGIINQSWLDIFPNATLFQLPIYGSDHCALKLVHNPTPHLIQSHKRFFFENYWIMELGFSHLINNSWLSNRATNNAPTTVDSFLNKSQIYSLPTFWDKASGPDGINPIFYHKNQSTSRKDLCSEVLNVLNNGASMAFINENFITLIPKKNNAVRVRDFRPISLCSTIYKVMAKSIANRLKEVLPDFITHNQGAFLANRIIFDNILIANEIIIAINNRKNGKVGWAALKLDMEKAFDKVEWGFIHHLLIYLGFPNNIITLIINCISTVSIRHCINNCLSPPILPTRGIRQGNPLSPYLFLLVAEGLFAVIRSKSHDNQFRATYKLNVDSTIRSRGNKHGRPSGAIQEEVCYLLSNPMIALASLNIES
uniref:Reverse transcriptase domain-containing protein n=1 Tax=Cannabis sativa TaxID=3483 RepID=A0A803PJQ9_CANSA